MAWEWRCLFWIVHCLFLPVGGNRAESFSWVLAGFLSFLPQKNNNQKGLREKLKHAVRKILSFFCSRTEYFQSDGQIMVLSSTRPRCLGLYASNPGSVNLLDTHFEGVYFFFLSRLLDLSKTFISSYKTFILTVKLCMMVFFSELHFWNQNLLKLKQSIVDKVGEEKFPCPPHLYLHSPTDTCIST